MALFTTIPAKEIIPIIVMMITKSFLEITIPRKTPAKLKTTDVSIITVMRKH